MTPYINWLGFYSFNRAGESQYPHRWVAVEKVGKNYFRVDSEHSECNFPGSKVRTHAVFLVQNNMNNEDILIYLKQQLDND